MFKCVPSGASACVTDRGGDSFSRLVLFTATTTTKMKKTNRQQDGPLVDDVSDIAVMDQVITFIQFYNEESGKITVQVLSVDNLLDV